jgi:hypothetical protein
MPRVRFTVRRMMIAVAVVALALGVGLWGVRVRRLSRDYSLRAQMYATIEGSFRLPAKAGFEVEHEAKRAPSSRP